MRIGFLGWESLAFPCGLVIHMKGHDVVGYDIDRNVLPKEHVHYREPGPNGEPSTESILNRQPARFGKDSHELVADAGEAFEAMGVGIYIDPPSPSLLADRFFERSTGRSHSSLPGCLAFVRDTFEAQRVYIHMADLIPRRLAPIITYTCRWAIMRTIPRYLTEPT